MPIVFLLIPEREILAARTMQNKETQIAITSWGFHCEPEAYFHCPYIPGRSHRRVGGMAKISSETAV